MWYRSAVIGIVGLAVACAPSSAPLSAAHATAIGDSARTFLSEFTRLSAAPVREALDGVAAGQHIVTRYEDVAVQALAPGLATVSARFSTEFRDSTAVLFGFGGAISLVLAHEPSGWRIVSGHSSVPVPR